MGLRLILFQKKKLIEYNTKKEEYENKISELYTQLSDEMKLIEKMSIRT